MSEKNRLGIYVHIPFCLKKCLYCDFCSFPEGKDKTERYAKELCRRIETAPEHSDRIADTLYFGGGTPSLISPEIITKIVSQFNLSDNCEITFEMNPDDAKQDYLSELRTTGVNRISMGSQTFNDEVLKLIGRRHSAEDTIRAVEAAKEAGFNNISLDLIYGLPFANIKDDLNIISTLDLQHISTYGLKIEEGSYFYSHLPQNLPDDDMQADMYLEINEFLGQRGYYRYEISNFAKKGYESKHNLNYWNNEEYYGFGAAAHGYVDGVRYSNFETLEEYANNPAGFNVEHRVTEQEKLEEEIFLGFRKEEGINIQKMSIDFDKKYKYVIDKYLPRYIQKTPCGYKLTLEGVLLSNNILSEFV